jgi:Ni,Fe-hydrogenase I cytochrome b subunit
MQQLPDARNKISLEVNTERKLSTYIFMSQSPEYKIKYNMAADKAMSKYLEMAVRNLTLIHEEIKSRLN